MAVSFRLDLIKRPRQDEVFVIVRNERYFLPHFLAHCEADPAASPFAVCPHFNPLSSLEWCDREPRPRTVPLEGVRPRMLTELLRRSASPPEWLGGYTHALIHKTPLLRSGRGVRIRCLHEATVPPSDRVQLTLAHFKFYPGYEERIRAALESGGYFNASIEYRFLAAACAVLGAWDLRGPTTRRYTGPEALASCSMLYSRLSAASLRLDS